MRSAGVIKGTYLNTTQATVKHVLTQRFTTGTALGKFYIEHQEATKQY